MRGWICGFIIVLCIFATLGEVRTIQSLEGQYAAYLEAYKLGNQMGYVLPVPTAPMLTPYYYGIIFFLAVLVICVAVAIDGEVHHKPRPSEVAVPLDNEVTPNAESTPPHQIAASESTDKRLCIECGNELTPNLKFCDSCGTKQS